MSPAAIEKAMPEVAGSTSNDDVKTRRRFNNLRGVQWRIDLGILPSSASSNVDILRKVTADSRRRYAGLRRRLLVDPHISKAASNSPDLAIDNPLSQNPDSTWGRFFRNAELEKTVDQDLSRLYPEHGSYFQTAACQGMLRRILLLWCLRHPECGYRQGMHELLAPLLYVLHVDVKRLSEVRKQYEDHFTDKFDGLSFHEYNFDFKKCIESIMEDDTGSHGNATKIKSLDELDPEIQTIVLLSDAYGAEGELGIVLSDKFMEHDAYCMFDALMNGGHGAVAMADFFSPSPAGGSHSGLPPVIEASAALYHLLSVVDSSLHTHLVELGVEPQYFALRWLRVLFGREFLLENLLLVWDEIFAADNHKLDKALEDDGSGFGIFTSHRGVLISAVAVSMILYLRSSLLATENATICLQRLLNFPENLDLRKLVDKAKSLQTLALGASVSLFSSPFAGTINHSKSIVIRGHSLPSDSVSPKTPPAVVPDSYWEEKWRVLHKAEEFNNTSGKQNPIPKRGWSEKVRLTLSRTASDPSPGKTANGKKVQKPSVRRRLLKDLSCELGFDDGTEKAECSKVSDQDDNICGEAKVKDQDCACKDFNPMGEGMCQNGSDGSEENSSVSSDLSSPLSVANYHEIDSEKSSVASTSFPDETYDHHPKVIQDVAVRPASQVSDETACDSGSNNESTGKSAPCDSRSNSESTGKSVTGTKERKFNTGKFQWFWKFGRGTAGEETSEKESGAVESIKSACVAGSQSNMICTSADGSSNSCTGAKGDADSNVMGTLRNLGNSMLEHIQVLESVFQQDRVQVENYSKNVIVGKGQVTAISALKELRKISNLLSEM